LLDFANIVIGLWLRSQFHHVLQLCGAAVLRFKQQHCHTAALFGRNVPRKPRAAREVKGAQYETMLHCREASAFGQGASNGPPSLYLRTQDE